MKRIIPGVVVVAAVLSGCVNVGRTSEGNPIRVNKIDEIKIGETSKAEITNWFGAPFRIEKSDVAGLAESALSRFVGDQLTLKLDPALYNDVYLYQRRYTRSFFLALILFNYFSADTRFDRLAVVFDQGDLVVAFGWSEANWNE